LNSEVHHFKVGAFQCIAVSDGTFTYAPPLFPSPAATFFSNAPGEQLKQSLLQHNIQRELWTEHISPYTCLLVNTGSHRVLVDTGADGLGPNTGRLLSNLKAEGITPESIDTVILTHCHPDHIGGNTLDNGTLAFPNARYVVGKTEWDFWTSEEAEGKPAKHISEILFSIAQKKLLPVQNRINLIEHEGEILPGIRAIATPGHTPGHMAIAMVSEGEQLLCIADTVLHPIHLEHPEWYGVVDFDPDQLVPTRRRILSRAAAEKVLVHAFHFPFPGLGYIVKKGDGWQWQPV
jgi:glyoxylase-like metal-dependent hydrolase (beta-lactamase superfamily II)